MAFEKRIYVALCQLLWRIENRKVITNELVEDLIVAVWTEGLFDDAPVVRIQLILFVARQA